LVLLIQPLFATIQDRAIDLFNNAYAIGLVLVGIGFVIFIHELGHFLVAKWAGVKVEMFSLGFGPTLISWRKGFGFRRGSTARQYSAALDAAKDEEALTGVLEKYGETEYSIRVLPLGGFVKMLGEDGGDDATKSHDPRAFNNKPVGSRMAIISAGVVMNLIFGILCAAWIHYSGEVQRPAIVGMVVAGSPAYFAGVRAGDEVVAIDGRTDISFKEIMQAAQLSRADQKIKFELKRPGQAELVRVEIEPKRVGKAQAPSVGLRTSQSLELGGKQPASLVSGDRVTAIGPKGAKPVSVDSVLGLDAILTKERAQPLVVVAEREPSEVDHDKKPKERVEATLEPKKFIDFGMWMTLGPVIAIRPDSPAIRAGFQDGDRLVSIDGLTVFDPMTLPDLIYDRAGKPISIEIKRGTERKTLTVIPEALPLWIGPCASSEPLEIPGLGLAVAIEPTVVKVVAGSPAAKAGVKVGSTVKTVQSMNKDGENPLKKPFAIDGQSHGWPFVFSVIQSFPGEVKFTFGESKVALGITPEASLDHFFDPSHGLGFRELYRIHAPDPPVVALKKGAADALDMATSIIGLLRNLIAGRLGADSFGGPVLIGKISFEIAKRGGLADFLPFLGLLSINLAVINFFPIPPLDGGQMVFLIAEKIRGRPLPENAVAYPMFVGVVFIIVLFVAISLKDVLSLF
jgi:regulator of sigma E protease